MGIWDKLADRQFATDESGRLVFLPRGRRGTAYFVDTTDRQKIKPLVKIYVVAFALINVIGWIASFGFSQALTFDQRIPLASKIRLGLTVYAIAAALLYIGPALLLWNAYRGVVGGICSSLTPVEPASLRLVRLYRIPRRTLIILLLVDLVILGLVTFAFLSHRPLR
jgi:hypothetical protein